MVSLVTYYFSFWSNRIPLDSNSRLLKTAAVITLLRNTLQTIQHYDMADHSHEVIYGFLAGLLSVLVHVAYQLLFTYLSWGRAVTQHKLSRMDCVSQLLFLVFMVQTTVYVIENNMLILDHQDHQLHSSYSQLLLCGINWLYLLYLLC